MDVTRATWRKSSRSSGNGGACVELAGLSRVVGIRDSKDPNGGNILMSREDFRRLTETLKNL
ncbi:hypothetical protein GCM10022254_47400 [Actinomadura meridiana]|uniref:DUF397 domain-containing protein n=1 Tax=Actinomadura meridiana TaxID=559626 RepID=A0ABP8CBP5_9ACTN